MKLSILKTVFLPFMLFGPLSSESTMSSISIATSRVKFLLVMASYAAPTGGILFGAHTSEIKDGEQQQQEEGLLMNVFKDTSKNSSGDQDGQPQDKVERGTQNLRKLKPKSNKGAEKKGRPQKSNKKGKKGAKVSYIEQSLPTVTFPTPVDPLPPLPTPQGSTTPESPGGVCSQSDLDCVLLFSEDYESPLTDFRNGNRMPGLTQYCVKPEGGPNALFYLTDPTEKTLNLAYGQRGNLYDESYLYPTQQIYSDVARIVYLKTFKESNTGKSFTFSDDRGGKYAISLRGDLWDKRLRLRFDTQGRKFVAFSMDISSFDDPCPFYAMNNRHDETALTELLVSAMSQSSNRTLSSVTVKAERGQPDEFSIVWTRVCNVLDVSQATDGMIFFDWNATTSPALFDNLKVIATNDPSKRPPGC